MLKIQNNLFSKITWQTTLKNSRRKGVEGKKNSRKR
jgi:hypothetical protein